MRISYRLFFLIFNISLLASAVFSIKHNEDTDSKDEDSANISMNSIDELPANNINSSPYLASPPFQPENPDYLIQDNDMNSRAKYFNRADNDMMLIENTLKDNAGQFKEFAYDNKSESFKALRKRIESFHDIMLVYVEEYDETKIFMPKEGSLLEHKYRNLYSMFAYDLILDIEGFCLVNESFEVDVCNTVSYQMASKVKAVTNLYLREMMDYMTYVILSVLATLPENAELYDLVSANIKKFHQNAIYAKSLIARIKKQAENGSVTIKAS